MSLYFLQYLYDELWAGDIELLRRQHPLMTARVLQHYCQVDQVVSHHIFILGWEDLLVKNFGWRDREGERGRRLNPNSVSEVTICL